MPIKAPLREQQPPTTPPQVRTRLAETLNLDLIGPWAGHELAAAAGTVRRAADPLAGIPTRLPPAEPARHHEPFRPASGNRGFAVLPHRQRQDRDVPRAGRPGDGAAPPAQPRTRAGASVIMRCTLRLLTLDQLDRALAVPVLGLADAAFFRS